MASATPGNGRRQQRITAQSFEREHGIVPDVVYINPLHYEQLTRYNPELFAPGSKPGLGFRLVIVPTNVLEHPHASLLTARRAWRDGASVMQQAGNEVAGWR